MDSQLDSQLQTQIDEAASAIRAGHLVVYPTETSYGIGADATNPEAAVQVNVVKERSADKILPIIVSSVEMAQRYVTISEKAKQLIDHHWPGALTLVLPVKKNATLAPQIIAPDNTVALRVSGSPIAQSLVAAAGKPIVSTSANVSNKPSCYTIDAVKRQFPENTFACLLDGGELALLPSTTLAKVDKDGVTILRQGAVQI